MDAAMSKDDDFEYSLGGRFFAPLWRFLSRFVTMVNPNPTDDWKRAPDVKLVLDLDENKLSGVCFDDELSSLSFLGPCDQFMPMILHCHDTDGKEIGKPEKSYSLSYDSDGVGFGADKNSRVDWFHVHIQPDPESPNSKAYAGRVVLNRSEIDLDLLRSADSLLQMFGVPDRDEVLDRETAPFHRHVMYERPHAMWMISIDECGRTQSISVTKRAVDSIHQASSEPSDSR